jgi:DNA-binding response OmpR family regulator
MILVVEDDIDLRDTLRFALEDEGFAVESAGDGEDALRRIRQRAPDLIILDLNMPRMGGVDFLYAWRTGVETRGAPVIVITAEGRGREPAELGVEGFFTKPFEIDDLLSHIKVLLAIPPRVGATESELAYIAQDLADVVSALLVSVEPLATAHRLPEEERTLAATSLRAAQRAAVLARRLHHLLHAPT